MSIRECGPNEIKVNCAPLQSCQPSCDNPNGLVCPLMCSLNSCVCKEGFIRYSTTNMTCVEKTQCKKESLFCWPLVFRIGNGKEPLTCGENEEYASCVRPCQPSCVEPGPQFCTPIRCSPGCVCRQGYLRATNNITSACIKCGQITAWTCFSLLIFNKKYFIIYQ